MPAYLTEIWKPRCPLCQKPATVTVFNRYNARVGTYCLRHGTETVAKLNKEP